MDNIDNLRGFCGRMSAKDALAAKIQRLKDEAMRLETLMVKIPWNAMSNQEEEQLWSIFIKM